MQALAFVARLALVVSLVYYQSHLVLTQGVSWGVPIALGSQVALQLLAVLISPPILRAGVALLAGWVSVVLGLGLVFAWVTVVIPIAALAGVFLQDDPTLFYQLIGLTAFMVLPVGVIYLSVELMDSEI